MGLGRLNSIMLSGAVPFNFGMTWEDAQSDWEAHPEWHHLYGDTEPRLLSDDAKAECNARAEREVRLVDALMSMSQHDYDLWRASFNPTR